MSPYVRRLREAVGHELLLIASAAVLPMDDQGRVLLVQDADSDRWVFIGGAIEIDEPPEEAAAREAEEEAGITIQITRLVGAYAGPEFRVEYPNGDVTAYVVILYEATVAAGSPQADGDETVDVRWFSRDDVVAHATELGPIAAAVLRRRGWL